VAAWLIGVAALATAFARLDESPPDPATPDDPDEIVVTGERVKRSLKDTPSSVAVFTEKQIDAMAADRLREVLAGIPNVQLGTGTEGPAIRGQDTTGVLQAFPAFAGGTRPRASLQIDGRAIGYQEFVFGTAPLWDVRQIEVFRSPQTVAHGRNAIGGAIIVNTNDPSYEWTGAGRAIHGDLSSWQGSAMASGPIVADQFAFRATADVRRARPSSELGENMRGASPNIDRYGQLRVKLLAEPAVLPGFRMLATFAHGQSRAPQAVTTVRPFHKRRDPGAFYGIYDIDVDSATLDVRQALGAKSEISLLASAGDTRARRFAPPGFGEARIHLRDQSVEPFFNWNPGGLLRLRGGVNFLRSELDQHIDVTGIMLGIGTFHDEQQSFGVYGEGEVQASDRLTLTLGARYQRDRQHRVGGFAGPLLPSLDFDRTFSAFLPKFVAEYRLSTGLKSGILIEKAYNPGGVAVDDLGEINTFEAERLWDFEAFVKGDATRRLTVALNVFYNAFRDAQRPLLVSLPGPDGRPITFIRFEMRPRRRAMGRSWSLAGGR
jgi:iron complex outermembrane receptor protein